MARHPIISVVAETSSTQNAQLYLTYRVALPRTIQRQWKSINLDTACACSRETLYLQRPHCGSVRCKRYNSPPVPPLPWHPKGRDPTGRATGTQLEYIVDDVCIFSVVSGQELRVNTSSVRRQYSEEKRTDQLCDGLIQLTAELQIKIT